MKKVLALTKDGRLTYCTCSAENRGKGRCNHIIHKNENESTNEFIQRCNINLFQSNKSMFLAKKLWDQNIYVGMKMENRNMTFPQTKDILDGVNNSNVQIDDIQAILDNRDAWKEMFNTIYDENSIEYASKLQYITAKHEALIPGAIRTGEIYISGVDYVPDIPDKNKIYDDYRKLLEIENIKDRSIELFCYITRNQIFWDGNKRTALLIANKELISNDCGVLCIDSKNISKFNELLTDFYESGNNKKLKEFLISQIKEIKEIK